MISFQVLSKRFFLKRKGLFDVLVAKTQKEYGFAVHFKFLRVSKFKI